MAKLTKSTVITMIGRLDKVLELARQAPGAPNREIEAIIREVRDRIFVAAITDLQVDPIPADDLTDAFEARPR